MNKKNYDNYNKINMRYVHEKLNYLNNNPEYWNLNVSTFTIWVYVNMRSITKSVKCCNFNIIKFIDGVFET